MRNCVFCGREIGDKGIPLCDDCFVELRDAISESMTGEIESIARDVVYEILRKRGII